MTRDSEKALNTIRRARQHVKRPAVVQASNGMEEALAAKRGGSDEDVQEAFRVAVKSARRWWDKHYWTITCPLPDGGEIFKVYDRETLQGVGGGISTSYHETGLDEFLEGRR